MFLSSIVQGPRSVSQKNRVTPNFSLRPVMRSIRQRREVPYDRRLVPVFVEQRYVPRLARHREEAARLEPAEDSAVKEVYVDRGDVGALEVRLVALYIYAIALGSCYTVYFVFFHVSQDAPFPCRGSPDRTLPVSRRGGGTCRSAPKAPPASPSRVSRRGRRR